METLERLWTLADREAERTGTLFDLGCIGLWLQRPLANHGYRSTPVNSSTFAATGGDGVHYGLLHIKGEVSDESPVVMTVPMMFEEANLVLGESLLEFLCLGCQVGYSDLEQLVYDKEYGDQGAVSNIAHPQTWAEEIKSWIDQQEAYGFDSTTRAIGQFIETMRQRRHVLDVLTVEFSLEPWNDIEARLNELNRKYLPALKLPITPE